MGRTLWPFYRANSAWWRQGLLPTGIDCRCREMIPEMQTEGRTLSLCAHRHMFAQPYVKSMAFLQVLLH
jgi:hypothetical protein